MIRVVALHRKPLDPGAYLEYYHNTHMALVECVPGVKRIRVGMTVGTPGDAAPPYWLLSEVFFDTQADLETGMASPEMRVAIDDVPNFAAEGGVTIMYCDTEDIVVTDTAG